MKTNMYVFVALLATIFFASCSKETSEAEPQPGEKTACVQLNIVGVKNTNNRAVGEVPTGEGDESKINTLVVGVFIGDNVNKIQEFSKPTISEDGKATATLDECAPGDCDIIVVANAPAGTFTGVTTKTAFLAKTVKLKEEAGVRGKDNLPMSGQAAASVTLEAGKIKKVPDAISLVRLVARIAITSITTDFAAGPYKGASFKAEKVFMYNAASTSTVAPGSATTSALLSGETDAANSYLLETINNGTIATPYWFYTFANGETTPTKLVISGKFKVQSTDSGDGEQVYYPIVINKTGLTGTTAAVARNTRYNLTATIKGKGVASPNEDITPATLTLEVSVAAWALTISQDVTFD